MLDSGFELQRLVPNQFSAYSSRLKAPYFDYQSTTGMVVLNQQYLSGMRVVGMRGQGEGEEVKATALNH